MPMLRNTAGRVHLERRVAPMRNNPDLSRPPRGWLRAMRDALGMTTRQLAVRMGKPQSVVVDIEKGELAETISLARLRQAAEAMGCMLVYTIVPNRPIDAILNDRAAEIANRHLARIGHTMLLENQSLEPASRQREHARLVDELLRGTPSRLWDERS